MSEARNQVAIRGREFAQQLEQFLTQHAKRIAFGNCWVWLGALNNNGYSMVRFDGRTQLAHRVAFVLSGRSIPDDQELDHTCRNPQCINPAHLEAVTHAENMRRADPQPFGSYRRSKSHCPNGHPYSGNNLYVKPDGSRVCRICQREGLRRRRALLNRKV